jgi:hypothetical protein
VTRDAGFAAADTGRPTDPILAGCGHGPSIDPLAHSIGNPGARRVKGPLPWIV